MVEFLNLNDITFEKRNGEIFFFWKGEKLGSELFLAKDNLVKKLLDKQIIIKSENEILQRLRDMIVSVQ